ncbi:hypothetical protein D3C87_2000630 [compost metagenome]
MVIIVSCHGVTIKRVNSMPTLPEYFITLAAFLDEILFENSAKNMARLNDRKNIPPTAQNRAVLFAPFKAFSPNRLLI